MDMRCFWSWRYGFIRGRNLNVFKTAGGRPPLLFTRVNEGRFKSYSPEYQQKMSL